MVRPLSWLVISDQFVFENTPEPSLEVPKATLVEVVQPAADNIVLAKDVKKSGFKQEEESQNEGPKQVYTEAVKDTGKKFWDGFNDLADTVEGSLPLLVVASAVPVVPGLYSGADVAVALNGYREWMEGKKTNNKQLSSRGLLKMVVSILPVPVSWAAPAIDKAMKVDKK